MTPQPFWHFLSESPTAYPLALGALALAMIAAYVATPFTVRLAHRFGILDVPDPDPRGRKQHRGPTPYLGGVAIILGLVAGSSFLALVPNQGIGTVLKGLPFLIGVAILLGAVGLADDVRPLPRLIRLTAQVSAALLAWAAGFRVDLPIGELNLPLTLIWIVGITNAFNLLDNMDGLTAGIAGIAGLSFAAMGVVGNLFIVTIVAAGLAGACFGFLAHNRHPAKVFMGDAGSMFIGFILALLGLQLRFDNLLQVTFLIPVVTLGIPILDTVLVVFSRWRHGRPIFLGGRDHISHRLVALGLPVRAAVGSLYWAGICLGWIGLIISRSSPEVGYMLLALVVSVGLYCGRLLWKVPVGGNLAVVEDTLSLNQESESAHRA